MAVREVQVRHAIIGTLVLLAYFACIWWAIFWGEDD
jgi:hypothetical protein